MNLQLKIFVISIKRNHDRLNNFLKQFPHECEIFEGVDGKLLYPEIQNVADFPESFFLDNGLDERRAKYWNKGQLGCAMSHLSIWKYIVNHNISNALVLEDDAIYLPENESITLEAFKQLPENWDLFYLGYTRLIKFTEGSLKYWLSKIYRYIFPKIIEGLSSKTIKNNFFAANYSSHLLVSGFFFGAHSYALSLNGAQKLLKFETPLKKGFDVALMHVSYYKLLNSYALKSPIFIVDDQNPTTLIN